MEVAGLTLSAVGVLPVALKLVHFANKFYNTYKEADRHQNQYLVRLNIEMVSFLDWVSATEFTDREAIIKQEESQNPELAEGLRIKYALACKIIWEMVLLLQTAADIIAPPDEPTQAARPPPVNVNTKRPVPPRRGSFLSFFSLNSSTSSLKSPTVSHCEDTTRSTDQKPTTNPTASKIFEKLEKLMKSSGTKTTVEKLDTLLKIESDKIADSCNRLSKRVRLKEAFASLNDEPKLARIVYDLRKWNKDLRKTLEKRIENNAKRAPGTSHISSQYYIPGPLKLPVGRNQYHTGRDPLLEEIRGHLESPSGHNGRRNVLLYGLSGYGKSSTAAEYAYRHKERYSFILWVDATNIGSLTDAVHSHIDKIIQARMHDQVSGTNPVTTHDFMEVAIQLDVDFDDLSTMVTYERLKSAIAKDPIGVLKKWLSQDGNNQWLLVVDNCDNNKSEMISKLIPENGHGHIIYTLKGFERQLLGKEENTLVVKVGELLVNDRQKILAGAGVIPIGPDYDASVKIANSLENTLLLQFVNGYLSMNKQTVSLSRYCEDFEAATSDFPLSWEKKKDFIIGLSFGSLSNTAKILLETLAFFPPAVTTPRKMLGRTTEHGGMEWMTSESAESHQNGGSPKASHNAKKVPKERRKEVLKQTLEELCTLQFLTLAEEGAYKIHDIPYAWLKARLGKDPKYDAAANEERACNLVIDSLRLTERLRVSDDWKYEREEIRRHIEQIYNPEPTSTTPESTTPPEPRPQLKANPRVMYAIATVFMHIGKYPEATKLFKCVIEQIPAAEHEAGQENIRINTMNALSVTFREQEEFEEARMWAVEALEASGTNCPSPESNPARDPVSAQTAKRNLALAYKLQGNYKDSLKMLEDLVNDLLASDIPSDDITILQAIQHKARVLCSMGKYTESLQEISKIQNAWKSTDRSHPLILQAREFSVGVHSLQGNYREALRECDTLVKDKMTVFGADHYTVFTAILEKADALLAMGNLSEASKEYQTSSNGFKKIFGNNDHPLQLMSLQGIATILNRQGNFREALELYSQIHQWSVRTCPGGQGQFTFKTEIANMQFRLGRHEEALLSYIEAETGQKKALGKDHGFTLVSGIGIAGSLECKGKYADALAKLNRIQELGASAWGEKHPHQLVATNFTASVLEKQGKYSEAEEQYTKAILGLSEVLNEKHPLALTAHYGLACIREHQGKFDEALDKLAFVIQNRKGVAGGHEHPFIFLSVLAQARIHGKQKHFPTAMRLLSEVISVWERKLDLDHPWTLEAQHWVGVFLAKNIALSNSGLVPAKYFSPALNHLEKTLESRQRKLGNSHPDTSRTMCAVAKIKCRQREYKDASVLLQKAVQDLNTSLGSQHPDTVAAERQLEKIIVRKLRAW